MFIKGLNRKLPEAMVLFFILFFPQNSEDFLGTEALVRSLFWRVPAVILILLLADKSAAFRPKKDCLVLGVTLPLLFAASFLVSLAAALSGFSPPTAIPGPAGLSAWSTAVVFSLSVGFMEEAFFRLYLPERILVMKADRSFRSTVSAFAASAALFALCHAWEGPWGIANALIAAAVLSFVYVKSSSFFGIALAHGLYNVMAFAMAAVK